MTVQDIIDQINEASRLASELEDLVDKYKIDQGGDYRVVTDIVEVLDEYSHMLSQKEVK